ncbi:MAG: tetratricopeptide repeat protein [Phycisphaerae bacterium]
MATRSKLDRTRGGGAGAAPSGGRWLPAVVVIAGLAAYANCFGGRFILDDNQRIIQNTGIQIVSSLWDLVTQGSRPVLYLSLAANFAVGGLNVWGYHAFNLAVHLLAALTLFGIVRRTLLTPPLVDRHGRSAASFALVCALIWVVHPLTTQSVTYIIQRAESMMALCYLFTLYCVIRGDEVAHAAGAPTPDGKHPAAQPAQLPETYWYVLAVGACFLGMGCKQVIATAPIVVLLYDRCFLSESFAGALRRRWALYLGLGATWAVLVATGALRGILNPSEAGRATIGFGVRSFSALDYARSQPGVILHYLRLSVWPHRLCLDYLWPVARSAGDYVPQLLVLAGLFGLSAWAFVRRSAAGFLGVSFFLILAPTSSFVPIQDIAFEHRMYLPLAVVVILLAAAGKRMIGAVAVRRSMAPPARRLAGAAVVLLVVAGFSFGTLRRNQQYHDIETMWNDVLATNPNNPRAYFGLGRAQAQKGRLDEAIESLTRAIRLSPRFAEAHFNLGTVYYDQGEIDKAIEQYREALRIEPTLIVALNNLAATLQQQGEFEEAMEYYEKALAVNPRFAGAHANLGAALLALGRHDEAIEQLREAIRLDARLPTAHRDLAKALAASGAVDEAVASWARLVRSDPRDPRTHCSLGKALLEAGKPDQAEALFRRALEIRPTWAEAHNDLGVCLSKQSKYRAALVEFKEALRLKPDFKGASDNLTRAVAAARRQQSNAAGSVDPDAVAAYERGNTFARQGNLEDAAAAYRQALETSPDYVEARVNLGVMLARQGRLDEAVKAYREALRIRPTHADAHYNLANALRARNDNEGAVAEYERALEARPDYTEALINLGTLLQKAGRLEEAIERYRSALKGDPRNLAARCNLAAALAAAGRLDEGIEEVRKALAVDPAYPPARSLLKGLEAAQSAPTTQP